MINRGRKVGIGKSSFNAVFIIMLVIIGSYILSVQAQHSTTSTTQRETSGFEEEKKTAHKISDTLITWLGVDYIVITIAPNLLEFFLENKSGKFKSFKALSNHLKIQNKKLLFAMNGGMYLPSQNNEPQGLYIEDGQVRTILDTLTKVRPIKTNFYLHPNGVFYIKKNNKALVQSNSKFQSLYPKKMYQDVKFATQSGPLLVSDNKIHPAFTPKSKSRHFRNAVGIKKDGMTCFVLSKKEVCFYDIATLFRDKLACSNALYLDGFVSKLYYPKLPAYQDLNLGNFGVLIGLTDTTRD